MTDNEFLEMDRRQKIRQVIQKYGEDKFYISFSGVAWLLFGGGSK